MAKKIVFSKAYTRDFSLIIEEAWSHGLTEGMASAFGWKGLDGTPCVYFLHNGAIEVWDNLAYIKKVKNRILQQNKKNSAWLGRTIATYNTYLGSILRMAKKAPLKNSVELKKFIQLVFDSMAWFLPFYYASHDSRTPKKLMEIAKKTRLVDVSFDLMDSVIRKSIIAQYPSLKGIENTLVRKDLLQRAQYRTELKERFSQFVMVPPDVYQSMSLRAYEKLHREKEFFHERIVNDKQIAGKIAYRGQAKGIVRIVRRKDQVGAFKKGEILVSPMTTPDFVPAMKKAAAIVTDEGGLLCHAAIISREMGTPCIIGTKIATQFFKDGDVVEVDASKGVIRLVTSHT